MVTFHLDRIQNIIDTTKKESKKQLHKDEIKGVRIGDSVPGNPWLTPEPNGYTQKKKQVVEDFEREETPPKRVRRPNRAGRESILKFSKLSQKVQAHAYDFELDLKDQIQRHKVLEKLEDAKKKTVEKIKKFMKGKASKAETTHYLRNTLGKFNVLSLATELYLVRNKKGIQKMQIKVQDIQDTANVAVLSLRRAIRKFNLIPDLKKDLIAAARTMNIKLISGNTELEPSQDLLYPCFAKFLLFVGIYVLPYGDAMGRSPYFCRICLHIFLSNSNLLKQPHYRPYIFSLRSIAQGITANNLIDRIQLFSDQFFKHKPELNLADRVTQLKALTMPKIVMPGSMKNGKNPKHPCLPKLSDDPPVMIPIVPEQEVSLPRASIINGLPVLHLKERKPKRATTKIIPEIIEEKSIESFLDNQVIIEKDERGSLTILPEHFQGQTTVKLWYYGQEKPVTFPTEGLASITIVNDSDN